MADFLPNDQHCLNSSTIDPAGLKRFQNNQWNSHFDPREKHRTRSQVSSGNVRQFMFQNFFKTVIMTRPYQYDIINVSKLVSTEHTRIGTPRRQNPPPFNHFPPDISPALLQRHDTVKITIVQLKGFHSRKRLATQGLPYQGKLLLRNRLRIDFDSFNGDHGQHSPIVRSSVKVKQEACTKHSYDKDLDTSMSLLLS
jgi:hypothetical protein